MLQNGNKVFIYVECIYKIEAYRIRKEEVSLSKETYSVLISPKFVQGILCFVGKCINQHV